MKSGNDKFEFYSNLVLAGSHHYTLPTVAAAPCLVVEIYEPVSEFTFSPLPPPPRPTHSEGHTATANKKGARVDIWRAEIVGGSINLRQARPLCFSVVYTV